MALKHRIMSKKQNKSKIVNLSKTMKGLPIIHSVIGHDLSGSVPDHIRNYKPCAESIKLLEESLSKLLKLDDDIEE